MKKICLAAIAAFCFATASFGQDAVSGSASSAESNVSVNTGAMAYNGGTTFEESAPDLGGLALGGGHPCAYAPATVQITAIGGGIGGGGMKVDSACMLMVMGVSGDPQATRAAEYIIAARDPLACQAMKAAGMVSDCVKKGSGIGSPPRLVAATKSAKTPYGKCLFDRELNRVVVTRANGATAAAAAAACKTTLGF
jgi:hypothetical protein